MSRYLQAAASAALAPSPTLSISALCRRAVAWLRACRDRRRERRELLSYLGSDHRAAADIGVTRYEAMNWSRQPFWRA